MLISDGKLPQSQSWKISGTPTQVLVKDLNNDGRRDFAFLEGGRTLVVHINQGWTCSAPSNPGVHVCASRGIFDLLRTHRLGSSTGWTVSVLAAAKGASGVVNHVELWVDGGKKASIDGAKKASIDGAKVNTSIPLSNGNHTLFVVEFDSKGASVKSPSITVHVAGSEWQ